MSSCKQGSVHSLRLRRKTKIDVFLESVISACSSVVGLQTDQARAEGGNLLETRMDLRLMHSGVTDWEHGFFISTGISE